MELAIPPTQRRLEALAYAHSVFSKHKAIRQKGFVRAKIPEGLTPTLTTQASPLAHNTNTSIPAQLWILVVILISFALVGIGGFILNWLNMNPLDLVPYLPLLIVVAILFAITYSMWSRN